MGTKDFYEAGVIGKWYTGPEAEKIWLVDKVFKETDIDTGSIAYAKSIAEAATTDLPIMNLFKEDIYADSI